MTPWFGRISAVLAASGLMFFLLLGIAFANAKFDDRSVPPKVSSPDSGQFKKDSGEVFVRHSVQRESVVGLVLASFVACFVWLFRSARVVSIALFNPFTYLLYYWFMMSVARNRMAAYSFQEAVSPVHCISMLLSGLLGIGIAVIVRSLRNRAVAL